MSQKHGVWSQRTLTQSSYKYIEDITEQGASDGFTGVITQVCPHMKSREQFDMLGTVSNYHALGFPSL